MIIIMRLVFILVFLAPWLGACSSSYPQESQATHMVVNNQGSLASTVTLPCISLDQVQNTYTPADLYPAVAECLKARDVTKASELFLVAGAYGKYDSLRITDKSAYGAGQMLILKNITPILTSDPALAAQYQEVITSLTAPGNARKDEICRLLVAKGGPQYEPAYMAKHGMAAFSQDYRLSIDNSVDPVATWKNALNSYVKCSI